MLIPHTKKQTHANRGTDYITREISVEYSNSLEILHTKYSTKHHFLAAAREYMFKMIFAEVYESTPLEIETIAARLQDCRLGIVGAAPNTLSLGPPIGASLSAVKRPHSASPVYMIYHAFYRPFCQPWMP